MAIETRSSMEGLVREDAVHRRVYTDPDIFALEMQRIFGRTWVFVAHESELPNPGDFKTTDIAGQPILISRHSDGRVHVLFNRCMHRGATVCDLPSGNAAAFRCPYHAWTYKTNGELGLVPNRDLFGPDFDVSEWGLIPLPRVATYGGFTFASLAEDGPSLEDHLGRARHYIDIFLARSPQGKVQSTPALKYEYRGNWKFQIENMSDNYHAIYVHASAMAAMRGGPTTGSAYESGRGGAEPSERPPTPGDLSRIERSMDHGHGVLDYQGTRPILSSPEKYPEDFARLREVRGEAWARELSTTDIHVMIYPNLILHTNYNHYRVIRPLAVDHTEINTYPCTLVGASDALNEALINATAIHVSPAGRIQIDDLEAFSRVQRGLAVERAPWVLFKMRGHNEHVNQDGELECRNMSEMIPRGYYREWRQLMSHE